MTNTPAQFSILHPKVKLFFAIVLISFFPIVFSGLSKEVHPLYAVFLLFVMVFLFSTISTILNICGQEKVTAATFKVFLNKQVFLILFVISTTTVLANFLVINALANDLAPAVAQSMLRTETVFVALGGVLIFKEQYSKSLPWVIGLVILGFTIMGYEILIGKILHLENFYFLHVVLASLCYGLFQMLSKVIIHKVNIYILNGLRTLFGIIIIFPFILSYLHQTTVSVLIFAALSAIAGPFLGRNIILSCTKELPLNYIGCNLSITPIFSLGLQWLIFDTLPTTFEMLGGMVITLAVLLFNLDGLFWNKDKTK